MGLIIHFLAVKILFLILQPLPEMVPGLQGQNLFGGYPDKSGLVAQLIGKITSGRSAARLAHHVRDVGVGCSNHLAPT